MSAEAIPASVGPAAPIGKDRDNFALLALPGLLYLGALFALPLLILLVKSLIGADGKLSLGGYVAFFSDPFNLAVFWRTLRVALLTTVLSLILAFPTAFVMARAQSWVLTLILIAMILPLSVGVIVKAFSWSIVLRSNGIVNQALMGARASPATCSGLTATCGGHP
jgi:putative spermidine/putrescine transport system permease protein